MFDADLLKFQLASVARENEIKFARNLRKKVSFAQKWGGLSLPRLPASAGPVHSRVIFSIFPRYLCKHEISFGKDVGRPLIINLKTKSFFVFFVFFCIIIDDNHISTHYFPEYLNDNKRLAFKADTHELIFKTNADKFLPLCQYGKITSLSYLHIHRQVKTIKICNIF